MAILEYLISVSDMHIMKTMYIRSYRLFHQSIAFPVYSQEKFGALMELSMVTDLLVTMANSLHLSRISFVSVLLLNGANVTINFITSAVNKVIEAAFSFTKWHCNFLI